MRFFAARLAVVLVVVGSVACGAKAPTQPDPVFELKTKTFTGNVLKSGRVGFPFTVVNPGDISVAITSLGPTSTLVMGIGLGFWEPATTTCVDQLTTNVATLNLAFAASPSSPGEYCVAIYDIGNVVVSSDFTLTVTHY